VLFVYLNLINFPDITAEMLGPMNKSAISFFSKLGHKIVSVSGDKSLAMADMLHERLHEHISQSPPQNCENNISPTFDTLCERDPLELSGSYLVWEN